MSLADVYRRRFLSSQGFAGGSSVFSPVDAFNSQLSQYGFYSGDVPEMPEELTYQEPQTMNDYLKLREINKQQQSGKGLAQSLDSWKMGRKLKLKNRYSKFL